MPVDVLPAPARSGYRACPPRSTTMLHVAVKLAQRLADRARLFAHPRVLQDRAHRVQRRHAGRRRDDPDPRREAVAHHLGEVGVQFGIDRLGRQEHQRAVRRLALDDVALGDGPDVGAHGGAEGAWRPRTSPPGVLAARKRLVGLERELRVDDDGARRVRQVDQAVGPPAVRQRRLQRIGVRRQRLRHDVVQLDLAEGPARLLVRQDVLQAEHVARQLLDIGLRLVDRHRAVPATRPETARCGSPCRAGSPACGSTPRPARVSISRSICACAAACASDTWVQAAGSCCCPAPRRLHLARRARASGGSGPARASAPARPRAAEGSDDARSGRAGPAPRRRQPAQAISGSSSRRTMSPIWIMSARTAVSMSASFSST